MSISKFIYFDSLRDEMNDIIRITEKMKKKI